MANPIRGEVELKLKDATYVLRPEHGRAVALDEALRKGILGTLVDGATTDSMKIADMVTVIRFLADDPPAASVIQTQVLRSNLYQVAVATAKALSHIAAGSDPQGEGDGQSAPTTGSTGGVG